MGAKIQKRIVAVSSTRYSLLSEVLHCERSESPDSEGNLGDLLGLLALVTVYENLANH